MLKGMKKIVISLIAIILFMSTANIVFAAEGNKTIFDELDEVRKNETADIKDGEEANEIPEGTNKNELINTNSNNENLPEKTPYTGVGDYSGLIFVAIFGISAIYAYKKVKEYNA